MNLLPYLQLDISMIGVLISSKRSLYPETIHFRFSGNDLHFDRLLESLDYFNHIGEEEDALVANVICSIRVDHSEMLRIPERNQGFRYYLTGMSTANRSVVERADAHLAFVQPDSSREIE